MQIPNIKNLNWEKGHEWFDKWYTQELEFMGFKKGTNKLSKLFTNRPLDTISLNTQWFHEKNDSHNWNQDRKKALQKGIPLLERLVSKTKKYLSETESAVKTFENIDSINLSILKKIKRSLIVLWNILDSDLGDNLRSIFEDKLIKKGLERKEINRLIDFCFYFDRSLAFQKEERDLRIIFSTLPKKYKSKKTRFEDLPKKTRILLERHCQKYQFLTGTNLNENPFTVKHFFKKMLMFSKKNYHFVKNSLTKNVKKRLTPDDLKFISLIRQHIFFDNFAADLYDKLDFLMNKLLTKQSYLSFKELSWYSFGELETLVKNGQKLTEQNLKIRRRYRVMFQIQNKVGMFYGKDNFLNIKKRIAKLYEVKKLKIITGSVANQGIVKGIVKIVKTTKDIRKVRVGDILVSPMTHPDLILAIKKCSAIITDTGGMTSHAAIISREYNIPCIVGTDVATKVLNDGDIVEVDAYKATVKLISSSH